MTIPLLTDTAKASIARPMDMINRVQISMLYTSPSFNRMFDARKLYYIAVSSGCQSLFHKSILPRTPNYVIIKQKVTERRFFHECNL